MQVHSRIGDLKVILLCLGMVFFILNHSIESVFDARGYLFGSIFIVAGFLLAKKRRSYSIAFVFSIVIVLSSCLLHYSL